MQEKTFLHHARSCRYSCFTAPSQRHQQCMYNCTRDFHLPLDASCLLLRPTTETTRLLTSRVLAPQRQTPQSGLHCLLPNFFPKTTGLGNSGSKDSCSEFTLNPFTNPSVASKRAYPEVFTRDVSCSFRFVFLRLKNEKLHGKSSSRWV
jgi:hypothetical protein